MPIEIDVEEIGKVEFPDDATQEEITAALNDRFGAKPSPPVSTAQYVAGGGPMAGIAMIPSRAASPTEPIAPIPTFPSVEDRPPSTIEKIQSVINPAAPGLGLLIGTKPAVGVMRQAANIPIGIANFLQSPVGMASALIAPAAPAVAGGLFAGVAAKQAGEQAGQASAEWKDMTPAQKAEAVTAITGTAGAAALGARGAYKSFIGKPSAAGAGIERATKPLTAVEAAEQALWEKTGFAPGILEKMRAQAKAAGWTEEQYLTELKLGLDRWKAVYAPEQAAQAPKAAVHLLEAPRAGEPPTPAAEPPPRPPSTPEVPPSLIGPVERLLLQPANPVIAPERLPESRLEIGPVRAPIRLPMTRGVAQAIRKPKPEVPEGPLPQVRTPIITPPPAREIRTWNDLIEDFQSRGTGNETRSEIQQLYPALNLSREAAGNLARDVFGNNWKPGGKPAASKLESEAINAAQKRQQQGNVPSQPQGTEKGGVSDEAGFGRVVQPSPEVGSEVVQETPVAPVEKSVFSRRNLSLSDAKEMARIDKGTVVYDPESPGRFAVQVKAPEAPAAAPVATTPSPAAPKVKASDFEPVLMLGDKPLSGDRNHEAIRKLAEKEIISDTSLTADEKNDKKADLVMAAMDDANHKFRNKKTGEIKTRKEMADLLGLKEPLQSDVLERLQQEDVKAAAPAAPTAPVTPAAPPVPAKPKANVAATPEPPAEPAEPTPGLSLVESVDLATLTGMVESGTKLTKAQRARYRALRDKATGGTEEGPAGVQAGPAPTKPKGIGGGRRGKKRSSEAGFVIIPDLMRRFVEKSIKVSSRFIDKLVAEPFRLYSEWMTERIARVGGAMSKAFVKAANQMISRERQFYGMLTPILDPARKAAGKLNAATRWLHGLDKVTPTAAISRTVGAIEGTRPVPAFAQPTVSLAQRSNLETGKLYQMANPNFVAGGKFQRNLNALGFDVVRQGSGEMWDKMVQGNAVANNRPVADVATFFRGMKKVLDDPGVNEAAIEKVNQDFQRVFPKAITHIHHAGQWQPILHADLFNYLETSARRATHVAAFRELFPNTPAGRASLDRLMEGMRSELPASYQPDVTALVRALQGHPTDNYGSWPMVGPGEPLGEGLRLANQTVGNLMAKLVLTGQMIVQPGETLVGSTPVFLGYGNYLRGLARVRELYPQMELQGAVNRVMLDMSLDPTSPARSAFRLAGNVISRGFAENFLNEAQEALAATTAQVVRERIQGGTLTAWERSQLPQSFKAMGFDPGEVRRMMGGDPDLLNQFVGKAASFFTSGNKAIAEGSRLGSNRSFNAWLRFQQYPMMKMNQFRKVLGGAIDAWKSGTGAEKIAATRLFGRFFFSNAMQGAILTGLSALFYEGVSGFKIRMQEAQDDPLEFLYESTIATMGGPLYLALRGARDKGIIGVGEQFSRALFPMQVFKELWDFTGGKGSYRDTNPINRIGPFVRRKVPGSMAISQGMAMFGLSQDNKELDAAINAFYRWKRQEMGFVDYQPWLKVDDRKQFRTAMRQATEALKRGDQRAYDLAINQAEGSTETKGTVGRSLRGKQILRGPNGKLLTDEEMTALRKHIGDRPVNLLENFDALLEEEARTN